MICNKTKTNRTAAILLAGLACSFTTTAYADFCEPSSSDSRSPYSNTTGNTRTVLSIAKHQYQGDDGKYDCLSNSEMLDGDHANNTQGGSDYFYFHEEDSIGDTLYFKVNESVISRTELRLDSFRADSVSPTPRFSGNFMIRGSKSTRSEDFTVAQLHVDTSSKLTTDADVITNSPMLRVAFLKERDGLENHFWAIYRPNPNDNGSGAYEYVSLGEALSGVSNENSFIIKYGTNSGTTMWVVANGESTKFDIEQWIQDDIYVYHKAGCYTDGDVGDCQIQFTELKKTNY
jgi:hypothetical protein